MGSEERPLLCSGWKVCRGQLPPDTPAQERRPRSPRNKLLCTGRSNHGHGGAGLEGPGCARLSKNSKLTGNVLWTPPCPGASSRPPQGLPASGANLGQLRGALGPEPIPYRTKGKNPRHSAPRNSPKTEDLSLTHPVAVRVGPRLPEPRGGWGDAAPSQLWKPRWGLLQLILPTPRAGSATGGLGKCFLRKTGGSRRTPLPSKARARAGCQVPV